MRTRREFLISGMVGLVGARAGLGFSGVAADQGAARRAGLGIGNSSYTIRSRVERDGGFGDPLKFLEFCQTRGAGGIQTPLGIHDATYTARLRARAEEFGMFVEGSSSTPRDEADVERFEAEVLTAKRSGATVIRTVMLSGRRYETFKTLAEYKEFKAQSWKRLQLAEPVLAKHEMRLAVENHKDFRSDEHVELLQKLGSEHIGACIDTGNNLALLEEPLDTARALAPWAMSCHVKDMAVEPYEDGFLLAEVPLGEGFVDLRQIVETLRAARPEVRFCLEMITRDPLKIPVFTKKYWATFDDSYSPLPGRDLARILEIVRTAKPKTPLTTTAGLNPAAALKLEDDLISRSIEYARKNLSL
jgi:sugar phosphate isomerase/epimerase